MMPTNELPAPKTMSIANDVSSTVITVMKTAVADHINMGTITGTTRHTLNAIPTAAVSSVVSAGRSATPSLRSIVPPALLRNATAAYTAVRKSDVAADLSAINWALKMIITAGIGVAVVAHARKTPPVPPGLDAMRWRKLLHNVHSWLHQKLKSDASLRRELEDARRVVLERENQPELVPLQSVLTEDQVDDFNDSQVNAVHLHEQLYQAQTEAATLRQQLEASASSQNELLKAQAELTALRQELQTREKGEPDLEELSRLRDEVAATKITISVNQAQVDQARDEIANLRDEVRQHEELQQLQDEELKDARKAFEDLQKRLDCETRDRKAAEEKLTRDKASMWSKFFGQSTPKSASQQDPGIEASPPPVPSSSPLPPMFVSEIGQPQTFSSGSKEPSPSPPAAEFSQPTAESSKVAAKIDFQSQPASTSFQPTPAVYTPTTNRTPILENAKGKLPDCTTSIHRKLDALKRLTSSAISSASSKRSRNFDEVEATPIPFKKPRLARQSNLGEEMVPEADVQAPNRTENVCKLTESIFTPGGRPSVRLGMPELRPAQAELKYVPSHDSTMTSSSKNGDIIESLKVKTPVDATSDDTALSKQSALVPVEPQQDPVGDFVMDGSGEEAEVPSSALAGGESSNQPRQASVTMDEPPVSDVVVANSTQQKEPITIIKTEPENSPLGLQEVPMKSETFSRNSNSDIDMAGSVQDVSLKPNVETTIAPTPSVPRTLRRRSNLPVSTTSTVRRSTRIAGTTKDLSEKALRERSTSPRKTTTTTRGKAGSQPPLSSKPTGVTKTPAHQTRSLSPKKMDAVKSAAASPRKRK
ncbi:Myosin tail 1 multi-domain protein [Pyrenophora teres f. maculata]|nr:Myosin tail 1 multi-domain protein [Pyrenophora teres f. maculata]